VSPLTVVVAIDVGKNEFAVSVTDAAAAGFSGHCWGVR
jgi:hypothetical protein